MERKIVIGLITNTQYLRQLKGIWRQEYLESPTARMVANWCWEYFNKYQKAPMRDIEDIYIVKLRSGIDKDLSEEIEDILQGLSNEYEKGKSNTEYLIQETDKYLRERQIVIHQIQLETLLSKGQREEAEKLVADFKVIAIAEKEGLDLSDPTSLDVVDKAFNSEYQNIVKFPGAFGDFVNSELVRGGFVAFMSTEKRGKTWMLIEFMMRAYKQKCNVAFFQAGDMTENQQIIRIGIYLAQKSNKKEYCDKLYIPVQDCIHNQFDTCNKKVRECDFGVFTGEEEDRTKIDNKKLVDALKSFPDYKPCYNCPEWNKSYNEWGVPWLTVKPPVRPLSARNAKALFRKFFIKSKRSLKLSTHFNNTLTINRIKQVLTKWEMEDEFIPDLIIIDYADLLTIQGMKDERSKQNEVWKDLRALSEEKDALVLTATQADAAAYDKGLLSLKNFSEDKRKYAHVTAMFGLNQDTDGREKDIGVLRVNKLVVREGDFNPRKVVHVLQRIQIGRPFLGSYY